MKFYHNYLFAIFAICLFTITSCKDSDPIDEPPPEVITTLRYRLTNTTTGSEIQFTFADPDGDGGDAPIISTDILEANSIYTGTLEVLNESVTPIENITEEIQEEDEEHQFFFTVSSAANATITYDDMDPMGDPIGLASTLTTGDASDGTLMITLRHEPNKSADGVADGDIANAGGETDIEVIFDISIQ